MSRSAEYQEFAGRLKSALTQAGCKATSPTELQRNFNARSDQKITVHAARKWLVGEAIPTQEKLRLLASWLGLKPEWLRYGEGDSEAPRSAGIPRKALHLLDGFSRLVERDQQLVQALVDNMLKGQP